MNREERRRFTKQKQKQKISAKTPQQRSAESHINLMNLIVAETFSRHSNLSEKEYLKKIGFDKSGKTESEAVKIATFNVMVEIAKTILDLEGKFNMANNLFRNIMLEEGMVEEEKGEEKNGK